MNKHPTAHFSLNSAARLLKKGNAQNISGTQRTLGKGGQYAEQ